ncbi:cytochrome P450 [Russula vinacea]|nr:cytochrome P450 [Russula vinacea]
MKGGQWLKFAEWHKKYGDLIYLNAAGQSVVVINSQKVAVELLDRRAAIYSDRPRNVVACDIMTGGLLLGFARYGETWRRLRRAANERFSKSSVKGFHETQMTEAVLQASDLLVSPARWDQHFRRAAASMILSVLYSYPTLKPEEDRIVEAINDFAERLLRLLLAKWKRDAESWYKQDTALFESLLRMVEVNVAKGDDYQIERAWIGGTMYVGGADTTSAMMGWWMLAMLAYPETQARAHAELDAIVGRARLPTFADFPHLPYIRAMVKEALRWRPVAPLGVPHQSTRTTGTLCLTNVWHMNRDPEIFGKNTEHFDPARYLDASGDLASGVSDIKEQGHFSYGFGRRNCVGRHMADDSLFINIAVMLWATKSSVRRRVRPLSSFGSGWLGGCWGGCVSRLSHVAASKLTWALLQTSGPLQIRDHSALSGGNWDACTGTRNDKFSPTKGPAREVTCDRIAWWWRSLVNQEYVGSPTGLSQAALTGFILVRMFYRTTAATCIWTAEIFSKPW